jgi:predicted ATPase/DNA-binding SARP family transcriptional activator
VQSPLRLHDLGPLTIEVDGVVVPVPGAKPARILATLLVNANRRVSVDTLMDAVWGGDLGSAGSGSTLETHIWRLRKVMEPTRGRREDPTYLVNDSGGYRLIVNPDNADSLRFAQLAEQGDRLSASGDAERALRRYELALTLWRGRPFDPVADEEWAAAPIARLQELYGQLHEQRVEALLRIGAPERAIGELEALIARLPYRERLWSQLMLALYRAGRVEEALNAYHRAREALLDTMGVEPGADLNALQQRILDRDLTLAPNADTSGSAWTRPPTSGVAREVNLPSRLSVLIGREQELERVSRLLRRSRLVTLVGAAGCGKTRLGTEVARTSVELAPDGVWFIDLTAIDDPAAITDLVSSTIGLERPPAGTALSALRSYVRDRQILLLVDNCEHLLPAVYHLLDTLLDDDSQCRVLATSREPIGLDGEVLWTLAPLTTHADTTPPTGAHTPSAPLSPAAQLFLARAQSTDPMFEPTGDTLDEIEAICAAVDGIPLAIELAAGRIRSASLAEVRRQVGTELAGLSRAGHGRTEHHRTVELSIDWSVRLLSDTERAVHARLSTLPGVFTTEAAQAVSAVPPVAAADVPDLLSRLVHRSLLTTVPSADPREPTRFRQLATVRAHAAHALAEAGESDAVLDRRAGFVRSLVAALPSVEAEDTDGGHAVIERNHDTLAAVLQQTLFQRPDPLGVQLVGDLTWYWFYQRRMTEADRWAQAAVDQPGVPGEPRAVAQLAFATMLAMRDRTDLALPLVREALTVGQPQEDPRRFAAGLVGAAWLAWLRGDPALDFLDDEVRRLGREDPVIQVWADALATKTALALGGPIATAARAGQLLDRALLVGNLHAAWLLGWLDVVCAMLTGDVTRGQERLRDVADYQRRLGGTVTLNVVEFEANFAALAGEPEQAAQSYGKASALAFRAGTPWPLFPATETVLAQVRRALPTERFEAAWQTGQAQT